MKIIVLADAYRFNQTDLAWIDWLAQYPKSAFLYTGGRRYTADHAIAEGDMPPIEFFRSVKEDFGNVDVLLARFSHFSKWLDIEFLEAALEIFKPKRFVLGYHCHVSTALEKEALAFNRADALILLNPAAHTYFSGIYDIQSKPVHFIRSLYLPRLIWYGKYPGLRDNTHFGLGGLTIRKKGRFSVCPQLNQLVPFVKDGSASVTVFGDTTEVESELAKLKIDDFSNFYKPNRIPSEGDYVKYLTEKIQVGTLNGFTASSEVTEFDKQNYPMRFNTYLKSNTIPLSIEFGYEQLNKIMRDEGFGWIAADYSEIAAGCRGEIDLKSKALTEEQWGNVCECNSFERYRKGLDRFLLRLSPM